MENLKILSYAQTDQACNATLEKMFMTSNLNTSWQYIFIESFFQIKEEFDSY